MMPFETFTFTVTKWGFLACLVYAFSCSVTLSQICNLNDLLVLKHFQGNLTNGQILTTWVDTRNCCDWEGVSCSTKIDEPTSPSRVVKLVLKSKGLEGVLSRSISQLDQLKVLDLNNNSFTGSINLDFTGLSNLSHLDLASNLFYGGIPTSISTCKKLETISISRNHLTGEIPKNIGDLKLLSFFYSSNNSLVNLSGALTSLQQCRNLSSLILAASFYGEEIPTNLLGFHNLKILALGNSDLHGEIPGWIVKCRMLQVLDLSMNSFHGNLPSWIGQMEHLFYLDLSDNLITGEIPETMIHLKALRSKNQPLPVNGIPLYVKKNQTDGRFLQYNNLAHFPPSIILSNNIINGTIPSEIGKLISLHVLDLSRNYITGSIPDSISDMLNLEALDLSVNDLQGSIPSSFGKLTFLSKFSVAYNHLQGPIPEAAQFLTFPHSSFYGNPGLCGSIQAIACFTTQNISPLPNIAYRSGNDFGKIRILGIIVSVGISIVFL